MRLRAHLWGARIPPRQLASTHSHHPRYSPTTPGLGLGPTASLPARASPTLCPCSDFLPPPAKATPVSHPSQGSRPGHTGNMFRSVCCFSCAPASAESVGEEDKERGMQEEMRQRARIILGSSSQSRQAILKDMGLDFSIQKANIDEKAIRHAKPQELVLALAKAKADTLLERMRAEQGSSLQAHGDKVPLLITADQVVVYQGHILEKPESAEEAKKWIRGYSSSPAGTVGATVVTNLLTGYQTHAIDITMTYFKEVPESVIDALVEERVVFFCAGALMVEHPLIAPLVTRMEGTTDAVMGLCKATAWALLHRALHSSH